MLKWNTYTLTLHVQRLYGGVPKNPDVIRDWLASKGITDEKAVADAQQAMSLQAAQEKVWNGFKSNGKGLYIECRQVKAMLKDSANVVKKLLEVKNLKNKLAERVFVTSLDGTDMIMLGKAKPDGTLERAIHVDTALGPRDALKRADYVDNVVVAVKLKVLDDGVITESVLRDILEYAAEGGVGADRSQGGGHINSWELTV